MGDFYYYSKKLDLALSCWQTASTIETHNFNDSLIDDLKGNYFRPELLYHVALISGNKNLLNKLSSIIEHDPSCFIEVASKDSPQDLMKLHKEINGSLLVEAIIQDVTKKLAPRFDEIHKALPKNFPANLVAIISSYEEPIANIKKSFSFFSTSSYKQSKLEVHEDYLKIAWERCTLQANALQKRANNK